MNDPNKRIDVNLSSLLSLKAELLRKQEEVSKAKSAHSIDLFVPKKNKKPETVKPEKEDKSQPQPPDELSSEEAALLRKSQKVLEKKSKYYDKMSRTGGSLNSDDNCLVMFNQKQQSVKPVEISSEDDSDEEIIGPMPDFESDNPNEQWVEYVDCLGRSRKCLKKDLEFFKKKDEALASDVPPSAPAQVQQNMENKSWFVDTNGEPERIERDIVHENFSRNLQPIDGEMKQQMKMQWEEQERENTQKEFIHYQDVLFDEARTHGVGYFKFSTDDEERIKQQKELDTLREATLAEQKKREEQRQQRENIIKERVKAARNRQRARQGLPPLEDEPEVEEKKEELYDTTEERDKRELEERTKKAKEKEERKREKERKRHVRPWDKEKISKSADKMSSEDDEDDEEDAEWEYKKEREPMTQEQWNAKQRENRPNEFAPNYHKVSTTTTKTSVPKFLRRNIIVDEIVDENIPLPEPSLYFTTIRPPPPLIPQQQMPIRNELSEDEEDSEEERVVKGNEIPPPPSFEYYGPTSSKHPRRTTTNPKEHLEKSIEAGLKFLREQSDKNASSGGKRVWTSKADY